VKDNEELTKLKKDLDQFQLANYFGKDLPKKRL